MNEELPAERVRLPSLGECLARSARLLRQAESHVGLSAAETMVEAAAGWNNLADTLCAMELNGITVYNENDNE